MTSARKAKCKRTCESFLGRARSDTALSEHAVYHWQELRTVMRSLILKQDVSESSGDCHCVSFEVAGAKRNPRPREQTVRYLLFEALA